MSQENIELASRMYDEHRDYTTLLDPEATFEAVFGDLRPLYDDEYEFHAVVEGNRLIERGLDGYLALMRDWLGPWEFYSIVAEEFRDLGPDKVVVLTSHWGRLRERGAEVRTSGVDVWTLRDGQLLRLEAHLDRQTGLEAARLRE
jgi:ketosteroid isomerase-like protein